MCGTVGSEFRVVVDAADVDCNADGVDDIGSLFIGENNPGLAGIGNEVVFDVELQKRRRRLVSDKEDNIPPTGSKLFRKRDSTHIVVRSALPPFEEADVATGTNPLSRPT